MGPFSGMATDTARFRCRHRSRFGHEEAELGGILAVQRSLGLDLPVGTALLVLASVNFATIVSISPGNLGVFEAASFAAYRLAGVSAEHAPDVEPSSTCVLFDSNGGSGVRLRWDAGVRGPSRALGSLMSEATQVVRVLIASYLEPHHVDRVRAVDTRIEVAYEPHLLPRPRYAADHVGVAFERTRRTRSAGRLCWPRPRSYSISIDLTSRISLSGHRR